MSSAANRSFPWWLILVLTLMSCEVRCKCHVNLCLKIRSPKKPVGCALRGTLPIPETQPRVSQGPHKRQDSATQSPHPTLTAMSLLHLQTPEWLCGSLQPAGTHSTYRATHRCTSTSTWAHAGQHTFYLPGKGALLSCQLLRTQTTHSRGTRS